MKSSLEISVIIYLVNRETNVCMLHVPGRNTYLNCYRDFWEVEKNKVFINLSAFCISQKYIQKSIILEKLFFCFFFKGHLKSIMPIFLTQHAQIISNLCEPETTK